jgi:hypothetical protein
LVSRCAAPWGWRTVIREHSTKLPCLLSGKSGLALVQDYGDELTDLFRRGSWAFLIGSYLQLYESLDTHPVEEVSPDTTFKSTK